MEEKDKVSEMHLHLVCGEGRQLAVNDAVSRK